MYKVVRTFTFQEGVTLEQEVLKGIADVELRECNQDEDQVIENCQDADAIIIGYDPITKRVLDSLPNLKLVAFKTIGFNFADVDYAREKGVAVSHISKYCTQEVADYAVGTMLSLNRRIQQFNNSVHIDKQWQYDLFPEMRRFGSQTVGLLGFGNIPRLITQRLKPFGPRVIAYDPYVSPQTAAELGAELVSMEEVLSTADIVSIHLPLNDDTVKIMNKKHLDMLKGNTIFINSARGSLVDEEAVIDALDSGKIRYYAADVVEAEFPDITNHPFASRDDVILTPHIAWFSQESVRDGRIEAAQNVLHFLNGEYDKAQIVNGVKTSR